jgi:hypothetical protein
MNKFQIWLYIIGAVAVALTANSISAIWAGKESKFTIWLLALILISPFVFITFGLVTSKLGVTISSGTVDSLLTISTIIVGLFLFNESGGISIYQYVGIGFSLVGIVLMQITK